MADRTEELETIQEINKELAKEVEYEAKKARLRGESVDKLETERNILVQQREQYAITLEYLQTSREENEKLLGIENARLERLQDSKTASVEDIQAQQRKIDLLKKIKKLQDDLAGDDEEAKKQAEERIRLLNEELAIQLKIADAKQAGINVGKGLVDNLSKMVGFQRDLNNTLTGNFLKAAKSGEGLKSVVTSIGKEMAATFGPANALQFLISNSIQTAVALDELQASFVGATGASREFAGSIEDVFRENVQFGVSLQESAAANQELYLSFGAFSNLSKEVRNRVAGTTAVLQELGVSASTSGENFNFLVSQLGMGVSESENIIRTMTETGASIGIPPQQLNDAFRNLSPRLAAFGRQGPEIFMKTAKTAKSLGMTVDDLGNTLFALSDGLDTFSESASAVAAVNLSLGGSFVNAFDLTMAAAEGPAAQLDMLRSGFQAAGKTLSDMPFFQQKMLASELGLELGTLQQVIDGNMDSQQALAKENPLEEMAVKANSAMDKLNESLKSISAGLEPLISVFNFLAENIKLVGGALLFATAAYQVYNYQQEKGLLFTTTQIVKETALAIALGTKAIALKILSVASGVAGAAMTAFGTAVNFVTAAMIANPIGAIILGVVALGGAIYGLIKNFDQVMEYMGGFFTDFGNMFNDLPSFFKAVARLIMLPFDAVWGVLAGVGQGIIDIINLFGADIPTPGFLSTSPSSYLLSLFDGGEVPGLAIGGKISSSGMAMVGEEGPELVSLPKGAQVVNNQSTTNLMKTMEETRVSNTTNNTTANDSAMLQALLRIEKALNMKPAAGTAGQPINVSVNLDKQKVGEATVDYINKKYDVFTSS